MDLCTVISDGFVPQAVNLIQSYRINSYNKNIYLYYFNIDTQKLDVFAKIFGDQVKMHEVQPVCSHALEPRVFFYKTYALNDCLLNRSQDIIYSDAANCFVKSTKPLDNDLIDDSLFMVYPYEKLTNQYWTTKECLETIDAFGAEIMPQYWAGFQVYRKTLNNVKFVEDMYTHMLDPKVALPDTSVRQPDGADSPCIGHRQDQSVLSLMIHKHNRHQSFDTMRNYKYGDWQTIIEFDHDYKHDFNKMIVSPRESKFNNFRFLDV